MKKIKLSDLTLREKIGQTLMIRDVFWANLTDKEEYLKKYPVGGVWSFGAPPKKDSGVVDFNGAENVDPGSSAVGLAMPLEMTKHLKVPPIIAADTVGGYNDLSPIRMSQMAIGATEDPEMAALAAERATDAQLAEIKKYLELYEEAVKLGNTDAIQPNDSMLH